MCHFSEDLEIARKAARAGADVVLNNFGRSKSFWLKGDSKGLVTETDLESERAILKVLKGSANYEVLSEESGLSGQTKGPVWVVDPLDGTGNFTRSIPVFTVSVGLMSDNGAVVGVIIDPLRGKEYYAAKGIGSFCNGDRLELTKIAPGDLPLIFLNHGYAEKNREEFHQLTERLVSSSNILKLGSTAFELCCLAEGSADAFICSGDELWDYAAGIVIAREAGYLFTDWKGEKLIGENEHLLFAHPEIHQDLVDQIADLQR